MLGAQEVDHHATASAQHQRQHDQRPLLQPWEEEETQTVDHEVGAPAHALDAQIERRLARLACLPPGLEGPDAVDHPGHRTGDQEGGDAAGVVAKAQAQEDLQEARIHQEAQAAHDDEAHELRVQPFQEFRLHLPQTRQGGLEPSPGGVDIVHSRPRLDLRPERLGRQGHGQEQGLGGD